MAKSTAKQNNETPRPWLSWSQLACWERNPNDYYQRYVEGVEIPDTAYLKLGRKLSDAMENGEDGGDPMIGHLVLFLPAYQKKEFEIRAEFEGVPIKGKLDSFDPRQLRIREYKSSKNPWTQRMVDQHGQLTFYALLVRQKYGKMPKDIHLDWAQTKEEEGELSFTGRIETFKTERGLKDLILMAGRIHRAWEGIGAMWKDMKNN